ncbi:MAG: TrkH family potassium uptake protein, partial [Oscillospiraceae bacterium]|nr:TrkH family potassium uptake protein [Oscillospiraceae bacterium]
PKSVRKARLDGKALDESSMRSILVYFAFFIIIFAVSVIVVSLDGQDLITNFTAVAATINNIGPGLSLVGPIKNYDLFSDLSKFVLMFDMLAGRLELFPLVLLFYPETWKSLSGKVRK